MAEVYGVKPKKFTKEWWPYFWMYYKWHTIAVIAVILMVLFTVYQHVTRPKYDLSITYSGALTFSAEQSEAIANDMAALIDDVDGNGKTSVNVKCYNITGLPGNEEMDYAMIQKLDLETFSEQSYIYILNEEMMERRFNNDQYDGMFDSVDEWADTMPSEDKLQRFGDKAYAVNLKDSAYMKSKGYRSDDMYALLKCFNSDKPIEKAAYEESKKILNELIK